MKKIYVPVGIEYQVQELNKELVSALCDTKNDVPEVVADYISTLLMLVLNIDQGVDATCIVTHGGNYRLIVKGAFCSDVFYGDSKSAATSIDSKVLLALLHYDSIDNELVKDFVKIGINTEMQKMLGCFAQLAHDAEILRNPQSLPSKPQNIFEQLSENVKPNLLLAAAVAIPVVVLLASALMPTIAVATVLGCALTLGQIFTCASLVALACEVAYGVYLLITNTLQAQPAVVSHPTNIQTLDQLIAGLLPEYTSKLPLQNYEVQF